MIDQDHELEALVIEGIVAHLLSFVHLQVLHPVCSHTTQVPERLGLGSGASLNQDADAGIGTAARVFDRDSRSL